MALAAAAELDRMPTAILRAHNGSTSLVGSDLNVKVADIKFLVVAGTRPRPDSCSSRAAPADPTRAAFVEVTVEPIRMQTILPASLFGGSNVLTAGAQAVAGFDQVVM